MIAGRRWFNWSRLLVLRTSWLLNRSRSSLLWYRFILLRCRSNSGRGVGWRVRQRLPCCFCPGSDSNRLLVADNGSSCSLIGIGIAGLGRCWRILCLAFIGDIRLESAVSINRVLNLLPSAVGEGDVVGPLCLLSFSGLLLAEVVAGVVILDRPGEVILGWE